MDPTLYRRYLDERDDGGFTGVEKNRIWSENARDLLKIKKRLLAVKEQADAYAAAQATGGAPD